MTEAPRITRAALIRRFSFAFYLLLYPLPWLAQGTTPRAVIAFLIGAGLFLVLPFLPGRYALTVGLRAGVYALIGTALIPFGGYWGIFFISAAATCGAIRSRVSRFASLAPILAVYGFLSWRFDEGLIGSLITLIVALGVLTTTRLSMDLQRQNEALAAAQEEIRALTLVTERERFARDLHDTLGHSLTLIALKSDLALRHLPDNPESAAWELREIGEKTRQALAETRLAVSAIRLTTLKQALTEGCLSLEKAGIKVTLIGDTAMMPPRSEGVLVMILREALTNILRHARAETCAIRFGRNPQEEAELEISDSRSTTSESEIALSFREGNGIEGMRARLAELEGSLFIEPRRDGTTLLITLGNAP
ncbi:histidine kinase [Asaia sp. BMEF1]|uniref:sensor histidine kinase n=1 Tax=Asaia sp. BMEF1 TaxID=3155932 RepID=UPI003F681163